MGGEKRYHKTRYPIKKGSPPHRRGKAERAAGRHRPAGITPAWAGKSYTCCYASPLDTDHPRVGGEKGSYRWVIKSVKGSPPRGRGKALNFGCLICNLRITPALAGKSTSSGPAAASGRDHPRVGGEKPGISAMVSSPVDDGHQAKAIGLAPANALAQQGLEGLRVRHLQNTLVGHSQ